MSDIPAALEGLRAGQTGIVVLGRVIMGDIAVTLVDLILREMLTAEETAEGGDWVLTAVPGTVRHGGLLGYEQRLLDGLSGDGSGARVSLLADGFGKVLDETRKILIRDAAHQGWVKRLHHEKRTARGMELDGQVRAFRRDLRRLVAGGNHSALAGPLLPFALRFGLLSEEQAPLVRFAHAWVQTLAGLPGWASLKPARPDNGSDQPLFADIGNMPGAGFGLGALGWLADEGRAAGRGRYGGGEPACRPGSDPADQ